MGRLRHADGGGSLEVSAIDFDQLGATVRVRKTMNRSLEPEPQPEESPGRGRSSARTRSSDKTRNGRPAGPELSSATRVAGRKPRSRNGRSVGTARSNHRPTADVDSSEKAAVTATDATEIEAEATDDLSEVAEALEEAESEAGEAFDPLAGILPSGPEDDPVSLSELSARSIKEDGIPTAGALIKLEPMGRYLADIRSYPPLERSEELTLARQFRDT